MLLLCNYYVTYKCNAFCEFCHFADSEKFKSFPNASIEDFISNIKQLKRLGVKFIDLTGGEPLLNKNIVEMAEFAKECKMKTSLTTNCLLYTKYAERLSGKIDLLHFSLDSPDEEEHNKIRRVKCFNKVLESVKVAKSIGERPDILFTVIDSNYEKLPRMYEIAANNGLTLIINPVFSYFGNPGLSSKALDYIEEFSEGKIDVYLNRGFIKLRRDGGNHIKRPVCKAVSRAVVISPDNEIILPCYHFEKYKIKIVESIAAIRKSEELLKYKSMEGRFDFCEGCELNCYFEPSFVFPTNKYGAASLSSKFKYAINKYIIQKLKNK